MDTAHTSTLLKRHTLVDTRLPEEARQEIGRIFCPHFLSPRNARGAGFHAVHRSARQRGYSLNFVSYGAEVDIDPGELTRFFLLQVPLSGSAEVTCGTDTAQAAPGKVASLLSPTLPTRMRWSDGCDKLIVLIDRDVMQRQCEQIAGHPVGSMEFATGVDLTGAPGRMLLGHLGLMVEAEEESTEALGDYLARLGAGLATLLITTLGHSQRATLDVAAQPVGSRTVAQAEQWIRANLDRPFAVADIAEAVGTSLRSLQESVRRHKGTTLSQIIEGARLERFHAVLANAESRLTVTEAASAAGIGHLGRAAAAYRRRYGRSPSQTLRAKR